MSECYEHEKLRKQGSPCPYCLLNVETARADGYDKTIRAIVGWIKANQPDAFRRGLWDAINTAQVKPPKEDKPHG